MATGTRRHVLRTTPSTTLAALTQRQAALQSALQQTAALQTALQQQPTGQLTNAQLRQLTQNQAKIEEKLAEVTETIRTARIYTKREK